VISARAITGNTVIPHMNAEKRRKMRLRSRFMDEHAPKKRRRVYTLTPDKTKPQEYTPVNRKGYTFHSMHTDGKHDP
jgi:hypothetical protein